LDPPIDPDPPSPDPYFVRGERTKPIGGQA
jgi:hypothetical protein